MVESEGHERCVLIGEDSKDSGDCKDGFGKIENETGCLGCSDTGCIDCKVNFTKCVSCKEKVSPPNLI